MMLTTADVRSGKNERDSGEMSTKTKSVKCQCDLHTKQRMQAPNRARYGM